MAMLHELVATADVVQHNMRYDAAVRLGVDYESLRAIKPDLVYCHTRGFEHGARGGAARQRPDRRRARRAPTGSTAASTTTASRSGRSCRWATPATASSPPSAWCRRSTTATAPAKGSSSTRRSSTRSCSTRRSRGAWPTAAATATVPASTRCSSVTTPPHRLYETADGWLCVAAVTDEQRSALASVLGVDKVGDGTAFAALEPVFRTRSAAQWFASLDAAGVPARCRAPTSSSVSSTIPR